MDRRALLQWMIATGGLAAVHRLSARDLLSIGEGAHRQLQSPGPAGVLGAGILSADELRTVGAAAECIIPRTGTPGATDAAVAPFVDFMLAEWYAVQDVERFRHGLRELDASSRARFGQAFATAPGDGQVELVRALDDAVTAMRRANDPAANAHWFAISKFLTVWGYCTSEVAMRQVFKSYPRAARYDGAAPVG